MKCFVIYPIQKIAACFLRKVFLFYKLYTTAKDPLGASSPLGQGLVFILKCSYHALPLMRFKQPFDLNVTQRCLKAWRVLREIFFFGCQQRLTWPNSITKSYLRSQPDVIYKLPIWAYIKRTSQRCLRKNHWYLNLFCGWLESYREHWWCKHERKTEGSSAILIFYIC